MTYHPRTTPRLHQVEALQRIRDRPQNPSREDAFALLMEMGTGKTKVILDEWGERVEAKDLQDLLVVAPAGCYRNWDLTRSPEEPSEIDKHLDPALRERALIEPWVSGGGQVRKDRLRRFLQNQDRPRVMVVNVEALSTATGAMDACRMFLEGSRRGSLMAVDESTTIRTHDAQRTKRVTDLGRLADARRILTGLVSPKSPMDLFSQFGFLDWRIIGLQSFYTYRARYAVMQKMMFGGRSIWKEVAYKNLDDLQERIAPYSFRKLKEECLDLEPKVFIPRDIELTAEQARIYKELKAYATSQLNELDHVTATSVITQMLRLHQCLCGHVVTETGEIVDIPERRTAALLDVLGEHNGKAVVWVTYDHTLRKLAQRLEEEFGAGCVARYWGGNRNTRQEEESRFKTDPTCRFMLSTPGAGGRGNTWVVADLVVYFANSYDLEQRQQSEDRTHRDGQVNRVTYVDLIARGTVDERIIKALRAKINLATYLTGENYRTWLI